MTTRAHNVYVLPVVGRISPERAGPPLPPIGPISPGLARDAVAVVASFLCVSRSFTSAGSSGPNALCCVPAPRGVLVVVVGSGGCGCPEGRLYRIWKPRPLGDVECAHLYSHHSAHHGEVELSAVVGEKSNIFEHLAQDSPLRRSRISSVADRADAPQHQCHRRPSSCEEGRPQQRFLRGPARSAARGAPELAPWCPGPAG